MKTGCPNLALINDPEDNRAGGVRGLCNRNILYFPRFLTQGLKTSEFVSIPMKHTAGLLVACFNGRVNTSIMRTFTRLRKMVVTRKDLKRKFQAMEIKYDEQFQIVFEAITQLIKEDEKPKKKIGYIKESLTKHGD